MCNRAFALLLFLCCATSAAEEAIEAWFDEPMPPGIDVVSTELDGPVFATTDGRTLYLWPLHKHRNGYSGETPGKPACYDDVSTVTAGLMSPYPAGIELPDLENRPSCTELWPPLFADASATSVGRFSIVARRDGTRQWAYNEQPLYTSVKDRQRGDVLGASTRRAGGDSPAERLPAKPRALLPPGFAVRTTALGRLLTTDKNASVYAFDDDTANLTRCSGECTRLWRPVLAPTLAKGTGEWTIFERSPGVRQWSYRGKPLYTFANDTHSWSQEGADVPGWQNVYTQRAPAFPDSFTVQETLTGTVLADASGMTIYRYICGDDSIDQLSCEHPDDTQVYRLAMCGGGDPERCQDFWRYVEADLEASGTSRTWRVVTINRTTGHFAGAEDPDALRVWAYRDRPVYTYGPDNAPGDVNGDGTGEWRGQRNGLKALWLRDDHLGGTL